MPSEPTAWIVSAATWAALAATAGVVIAVARTRPRLAASAAVIVATGAVVSGAAQAAGPRPKPPPISIDWPGQRPSGRPGAVIVQPGDCLWSITARRLVHPSAARVATRWPSWWHANRAVIGSDPDLLRPGQRLRPPARSPWRH